MDNRSTHRWTVHPDRGRVCEFCYLADPPLREWCPPCPYPTRLSDPVPRHARFIGGAFMAIVLVVTGCILIAAWLIGHMPRR
jgi:hypothetical protein